MPVNFTGSYTQNFDSLANTGTSNVWANDSTILGWSLFKQPTPGTAITTYGANDGVSTTGSFISYGYNGSLERALGGLGSGNAYFGSPASGAVAGWIAFAATNTTGATLNAVNLAFNGEQWRTSNNIPQFMVLQYGLGASFAAVSTWITPGGTFDWSSRSFLLDVRVDGNVDGLVANRGGTLNSLNWANNSTLWVRWIENNDNGNDHGLAIDNFSLTASVTPTVNLSVTSNAGSEAGTTVITVTATASSAVSGDQTLSLGVSGTDITAGDYTLSNSIITILNGQTTGTATFTVVDDVLIEGTETATLTLSSPSAGITLGSTTTQNITIADNDFPIISLAAGTNPVEGSTQGTYTFTLDAPAPAGGLTVNYNLTGSTATNPADYTLAAGTNITDVTGSSFIIAAGQTSATLLVNAVNDGISDPNETVKLNLAAGSGYTTGYNSTTPFTAATPVAVGSSPFSVAIGDFNGDGKADIAAANVGSNTVSIRLGNGLGGFTGTPDVMVGTTPYSVAIGDFNGDGRADFAAANFDSSTVSIRLGDGLGGFTSTPDVMVGSSPFSVAIGDFNGDGRADFAAANVDSNTVSIRLGNGLGGFTSTPDVMVGSMPYSVEIGDFNGDGRADFAAANFGSNTISIRLGNGLGGFTGTPDVMVGSRPFSVAIGDFNGDGRADFAAANVGSNTVSIRLGNGLGGFTGTPDVMVGTTPYSVAIGDFNGDGRADFAAANTSSNTVSIRLGNGLGGFTGTPDVMVGTTPYSVAIGDFNGDGKADVAAANFSSNNVSVLLNNSPSATLTIAEPPTVNLSVNTTDGSEAGTTLITVTATASSAVVGAQTLSLGVSGTGITAGDYTLSNSTITILDGQTMGTTTFTVVDDVLIEDTETATLTLSNPSAGIVLGSTTTQAIGITDNDFPAVNLSVTSNAGSEAGTTLITVTATASSAVVGSQTLSLGVSGTNITAGDYTLSNPTITILNGQTTGTATFTVVDDVLIEGTETATLTLSNPSAGIVLGSTTTQAIGITDNDFPAVNLSVTSNVGSEAGTTLITVTATAASAVVGAQTLNLGVSGTNITAGDYTLSNPTITILNRQTTGTATFTVVDDVLIEGTETATLTLSNPSAGIVLGGTTTQAIAITDNDNPPTDLILSATTTINENVAPNTLIGSFTTFDLDGGNFTYSFVSGTGSTNNSAFTITGDQLRLNASPDFETQPSYNIRVRTTDFSGLTYDQQISIIVNNLNDAPILTDTVVTLNSVRINAPAPLGAVGTSITQLANLTGGSGQNNVIDPDAGALTGIAITATDTSNGSWFYSTNNGTNWTAIGAVSNANALLLADTASTRLYFRPTVGYTGTLANAITYRAWDQTSGTNGTTPNTTDNGNPTAFSVQFDTASLQVNRTETTDFTKDGITDILWRNSVNGQNLVWEMDGTTYKSATFLNTVAANSGWNAVATGDFTKDGKTDILWRNSGSGQNLVWEMDGTTYKNATFLNSVAANSGWDVVGAGDFTKDGKTDILWRNSGSGQNLVWEMDGTTYKNATFLNSVAANSGWDVVGTGDFTKDGKTDILWRNSGSGQNLVWEMDGTTYKNATFIESVPNSSGWKIAGVGDFTNDGNADVLWHNSLDGSVAMWGMNGTTRSSFVNVGTVSPSSGWNIV